MPEVITANLAVSKAPAVPTAQPAEDVLAQFEEHLDNLAKAMTSTERAGDMADSYRNKGAFTLFLGSVTGTGQRDLARMVELLAGNLQTTQLALELVMKMQIRKNADLRDFHDAITRKIENIAIDSTTLDANQREAAIFILAELRHHVEEQIAHQALVDSHSEQLQELQDRLHEAQSVLEQQAAAAEHEIEGVRVDLSTTSQRAHALSLAYDEALHRIAELEKILRSRTTRRAKFVRFAVSIAAIGLSMAALGVALFHV